jgi:hypothetical protein
MNGASSRPRQLATLIKLARQLLLTRQASVNMPDAQSRFENKVAEGAGSNHANSPYRQKDVELCWVKGDPLLKNVEPDPRYTMFLRKMQLPP